MATLLIASSDKVTVPTLVTTTLTATNFNTVGIDTETISSETINATDINAYTINVNTLNANNISGSDFTGNSATASSLEISVNINETSFDGSSDIVTNIWGATRDLTIGDAVKPVNGSTDVSFTPEEIGLLNTFLMMGA